MITFISSSSATGRGTDVVLHVHEDDVNSESIEERDVNIDNSVNTDSENVTVPKSSSGRRIRFKKDNDYFYF